MIIAIKCNYIYDHYYITPTLKLAQVQAKRNACPCLALHLLDNHSSLKYRQKTWNPWIWFLALASTYESATTHRIHVYLYAEKIINVIFTFLSKRFLQYKCLSMSLKKSWGQQQNAIGVTFHSPIVIILTFDTLGLVYSVFVRMNLGALRLPVSGWLCIHSNVYSHLS